MPDLVPAPGVGVGRRDLGEICGYRIEDIQTPLTKQVRYLDKLVDELAKGKKMEKILRGG
jgi:hypothetical protein